MAESPLSAAAAIRAAGLRLPSEALEWVCRSIIAASVSESLQKRVDYAENEGMGSLVVDCYGSQS
jgi:hypothetical protein